MNLHACAGIRVQDNECTCNEAAGTPCLLHAETATQDADLVHEVCTSSAMLPACSIKNMCSISRLAPCAGRTDTFPAICALHCYSCSCLWNSHTYTYLYSTQAYHRPGMQGCAQPLRRADVVRDLRIVVQEVHRPVVERVVRRHRLGGGGRRELRLPVPGHLEALRRDYAWQRGHQGVSSAAP